MGAREEEKKSAGQVERAPSAPHFTLYKTDMQFLAGPSHQPRLDCHPYCVDEVSVPKDKAGAEAKFLTWELVDRQGGGSGKGPVTPGSQLS